MSTLLRMCIEVARVIFARYGRQFAQHFLPHARIVPLRNGTIANINRTVLSEILSASFANVNGLIDVRNLIKPVIMSFRINAVITLQLHESVASQA